MGIYKIGLTSGGMTDLKSLTVPIPYPKSSYRDGAGRLRLGNKQIKDVGLPVAVWDWGFLSQAQRDQLRTFCAGASATVYIQTRTNETADTFDTFSAIMEWPEGDGQLDFTRRVNFSVQFTDLVPL